MALHAYQTRSLAEREEYRRRVSGNSALMAPNGPEMTGEWNKLHSVEFHT
jgi:hypothetical protein